MNKAIFSLVAVLTAFVSHTASACILPTMTTSHIRELVRDHGGWPVSDAQCRFLAAHHLFLHVNGQGVVLNGVNVGWATVSLQNADGVTSTDTGVGTSVSRALASQVTANEEAYDAIRTAIADLHWTAAVREVDRHRVATSGGRITERDWRVL